MRPLIALRAALAGAVSLAALLAARFAGWRAERGLAMAIRWGLRAKRWDRRAGR